MATRKKGGQRLIEMARKRRKSLSTKKGAVRPKRLKGGQKLLAMSGVTASRKRAAQKRKQARATKEDRPGGRFYKTPLKAKPKAKPKAKAKTAVIKRGGTTITYKPKPSPQLKPKAKAKRKIHTVRMYTAEDERKYEERYKKTARKSDPAFAEGNKPLRMPGAKPKATKKPVVTPPKGVKAARPGAGLTKRLTTIRKKAASSKAARSRTARQTPKGAGRSLRADLTKEQKALRTEGAKLAKRLKMGPERFVGNLSVKTAEDLSLPFDLIGWGAAALAARGKGGTGKKFGSKLTRLKELFKGKGTPVGGGRSLEEVKLAHTAAARGGRSAKEIADAKKAADKAEKLRKKLLADKKLQRELETLDAAARKRAGIGSATSRGAK